MNRARRRSFASALLLASCTIGAPAFAQDASDLERAKASFKAGANAYAAGDYLAAIQALDAAYELTPLPAIAFSIAQAERKQYLSKNEREHLERAVALFRRYLEQAPDGPRRADARAALRELEPELGRAAVPETPAKVQARPTRLMIVSDTPGARITLDGGVSSPSPLIREVAPGRHRAHVVAKGYDDVDRDVTAVAGELLLTEVPLVERSSSLYVWAPEGADIYLDGVYMAQGGPLATLAVRTGRHQLVVAQPGKRVVRRELRLARGQAHTEVVTLEPTTQRSLSEYLFIGGGVALGGGVVLSALAVRSQNRAEDFLQRQSHRAVSSAELVSYNAYIAERNRYRTGAAIGVATSFGFFITGLFLHELDRPSLAAATRRSEPHEREGSLSSPRFAFSPVTATGDLGGSLRLSF
jgi:tetratricopeptide (TPR) repeat protein